MRRSMFHPFTAKHYSTYGIPVFFSLENLNERTDRGKTMCFRLFNENRRLLTETGELFVRSYQNVPWVGTENGGSRTTSFNFKLYAARITGRGMIRREG